MRYFRDGHVHQAIVCTNSEEMSKESFKVTRVFKQPGDKADFSSINCSFDYEVKGIVCMENIIEAMLGMSILDEKDK
jgi:hypothetical protein